MSRCKIACPSQKGRAVLMLKVPCFVFRRKRSFHSAARIVRASCNKSA